MNAIRGRWGWYSCDYQTYLKLKIIKKRYWETIYAAARYHRWERKLPKNRKGPEPPKPCPFIGEQIWGYKKKEDGTTVWAKQPNKRDQSLLEWLETARMPKATEAEIQPFMKSQFDIIEEVYNKVEDWFTEEKEVA